MRYGNQGYRGPDAGLYEEVKVVIETLLRRSNASNEMFEAAFRALANDYDRYLSGMIFRNSNSDGSIDGQVIDGIIDDWLNRLFRPPVNGPQQRGYSDPYGAPQNVMVNRQGGGGRSGGALMNNRSVQDRLQQEHMARNRSRVYDEPNTGKPIYREAVSPPVQQATFDAHVESSIVIPSLKALPEQCRIEILGDNTKATSLGKELAEISKCSDERIESFSQEHAHIDLHKAKLPGKNEVTHVAPIKFYNPCVNSDDVYTKLSSLMPNLIKSSNPFFVDVTYPKMNVLPLSLELTEESALMYGRKFQDAIYKLLSNIKENATTPQEVITAVLSLFNDSDNRFSKKLEVFFTKLVLNKISQHGRLTYVDSIDPYDISTPTNLKSIAAMCDEDFVKSSEFFKVTYDKYGPLFPVTVCKSVMTVLKNMFRSNPDKWLHIPQIGFDISRFSISRSPDCVTSTGTGDDFVFVLDEILGYDRTVTVDDTEETIQKKESDAATDLQYIRQMSPHFVNLERERLIITNIEDTGISNKHYGYIFTSTDNLFQQLLFRTIRPGETDVPDKINVYNVFVRSGKTITKYIAGPTLDSNIIMLRA